MSSPDNRREDATVNHANEAVEIAILAADYEPIDAAIAYGIRCVEHKYSVEFDKHLVRYINNQAR
jgi:hypothetical protein